ncbi:MAG: hypothetical protein DI587_38325 [Variovorax paradoxus]|nr:MAG: hypothetical protein DI583_38325 [Variovorax paradoxus]PZP99586.1 MAG: hypothetical protein DI587_38325 [Variovorax paradoxus]
MPSLQDDALVKQLPAHPTLLTVYVVRQNLADGQDVIKVVADDVTTISTLPDTIARLRFKPGEHTLSFLFEEQRGSVEVEGQAGEVRFVRLRGVGFAWAVRYDWMHSTAQATRKKVWRARLIADVLVP